MQIARLSHLTVAGPRLELISDPFIVIQMPESMP